MMQNIKKKPEEHIYNTKLTSARDFIYITNKYSTKENNPFRQPIHAYTLAPTRYTLDFGVIGVIMEAYDQKPMQMMMKLEDIESLINKHEVVFDNVDIEQDFVNITPLRSLDSVSFFPRNYPQISQEQLNAAHVLDKKDISEDFAFVAKSHPSSVPVCPELGYHDYTKSDSQEADMKIAKIKECVEYDTAEKTEDKENDSEEI